MYADACSRMDGPSYMLCNKALYCWLSNNKRAGYTRGVFLALNILLCCCCCGSIGAKDERGEERKRAFFPYSSHGLLLAGYQSSPREYAKIETMMGDGGNPPFFCRNIITRANYIYSIVVGDLSFIIRHGLVDDNKLITLRASNHAFVQQTKSQ